VPSQSNQAAVGANVPARDFSAEGASFPSMCGVEADNATYCQGVQPITIEPVECISDDDDVEPLTYTQSLPPCDVANTAVPRQTNTIVTRPGADGVTQPAMRVVYCGTVSGDQLLEQGALGDLAQNLISSGNSSAMASNVCTPEYRGRNLSDFRHDSTVGARECSVECIASDVSGLIATDNSRVISTVQRHNASTSTPNRAKQQLPSKSNTPAATPSDTDLRNGRKSTSSSKSHRAQSLDSESAAVRRRSVILIVTNCLHKSGDSERLDRVEHPTRHVIDYFRDGCS